MTIPIKIDGKMIGEIFLNEHVTDKFLKGLVEIRPSYVVSVENKLVIQEMSVIPVPAEYVRKSITPEVQSKTKDLIRDKE